MLVLSRKALESIVITAGPHKIVLTVIEIRKDRRGGATKVRLGFDAPPEVQINRSEIQLAIERDGAKTKGTHAT